MTLGDFSDESNSTELFFTFPSNVNKYKTQAGKIIQALLEIDINATSPHDIIELRLGCIEHYPKEFIISQIKELYLEHYPSMKISKIEIEPINELDTKIEKQYIKEVVINKTALRSNDGSFYLIYDKNRQRRIYFDLKISADITLLKAKSNLERKKTLSTEDVESEMVYFDRVRDFPITLKDIKHTMLRRYIKKGEVIYRRDITQSTLIKKNSTVKATIKDGGVELVFSATALDDGDVGDIIEIRKPNGKQYSATITGKNQVLVK